jgi:histidinol-phosphate aminotransferase
MVKQLIRKNILNLKPYSSARDDFQGIADVYLDANENPYPSDYNRYPDPLQQQVKVKLGELKGVSSSTIFLGNGSDEAIDLLIRVFCEPNQDSILITEPTYGMYEVCAGVNAVNVKRASLTNDFQLDLEAIFNSIDSTTKLIFLCSPNNPSGNLLEREKIEAILREFKGIVVLDEAYIDFANDTGFLKNLPEYPNLAILQTFSKAWGLAGLRLGICYASEEILQILNRVKYPYNVNSITQQRAIDALTNYQETEKRISELVSERKRLEMELNKITIVKKIYPSDANFLLVKTDNAKAAYQKLLDNGIIVRDRSSVIHCDNCLRITVGTPHENDQLIKVLKRL